MLKLLTGRCSDQDLYEYVNILIPELNDDGLCISEIVEWNNIDCSRFLSLNTSFPDYNEDGRTLDFPFKSFCVRVRDERSCSKYTNAGYDWRLLSKTQEQCEKEKDCFEEQRVPSLLHSKKDQSQCSLCDGDFVPSFQWTKGEWRGGKLKQSHWYESSVKQTNRWESSVDFDSLTKFFIDSLTRTYTNQLGTELQCRINPTKSVIERITCVCEMGIEKCSFLNENYEDTSLGVAELCSDTSTTILAPPSLLEFGAHSHDYDSCVQIVVFSLPSYLSQSSKKGTLSLSFRKAKKDQMNVWNEKGGTVGKVIGSGIELTFQMKSSNENKYHHQMEEEEEEQQQQQKIQIKESRVCFTIDYSSNKYLENEYSFDFGSLKGDKIIPLGVKSTIQDNLLCAENVTLGFQLNTLYPIWRENKWNDKEPDEYSDSQLSVYSILLILFFVQASFIFFNEINQFGFVYWHDSRLFTLFLFFGLLVRSIYFLWIVIEQPNDSETIEEFVFLTIPTFSYLSAVSISAMLWALVSKQNFNKKNSTKITLSISSIKSLTLVSNISLYMILVVICILVDLWEDHESYSCFQKIYHEPDTNNYDTLRIVYSIFLVLFTLGIVSCVFYFSGSAMYTFSLLKNSNNRDSKVKRWLTITLVAALIVIFQCIFQVCYSFLATPSYEYAIFLIPLEIFPLSIIIYFLLVIPQSNTKTFSKGSSNQDTIVPGNEL